MIMATSEDKQLVPEKLPFLEAICWQTDNVYRFDNEQMLSRYERGWRYRSMFNNLESRELNFVRELARRYDSWLQSDPCILS
jgi:hypothetical protein